MPDINHWAARTARARNDLAHEGETPSHTLEELVVIVEVTTTVVILNLLHELGLSAGRQRELVLHHPHLSQTAQRAKAQLAPVAIEYCRCFDMAGSSVGAEANPRGSGRSRT